VWPESPPEVRALIETDQVLGDSIDACSQESGDMVGVDLIARQDHQVRASSCWLIQ